MSVGLNCTSHLARRLAGHLLDPPLHKAIASAATEKRDHRLVSGLKTDDTRDIEVAVDDARDRPGDAWGRFEG